MKGLPGNSTDFMDWDWEQIKPFSDELLSRELTKNTISEWLEDWSQLTSLIMECFHRLEIRTTTHTNDERNTRAYQAYAENLIPRARLFEQQLTQKLLESGLEPENFSIPLRKMRTDAKIFREENLPLKTEIEKVLVHLQEIDAARLYPWGGEQLNERQVLDKLTESDRAVRERAWRLITSGITKDREKITEIWGQLLDLRIHIARNAGFDDYRAFRWQELGRFDYTPEDCRSFHHAIEEVVVPAYSRLSEKRKISLGVERLRVWDNHWFYKPDPSGLDPIRPYKTIPELNQKMEGVFSKVDPQFGKYYRLMVDEKLLDLETRKNKAPGGYMEELPASKRPFIFVNGTNSTDDINTLLHEGGHAFHTFECLKWPSHHQASINNVPIEFVEVPSMAMEFLAVPYLGSDQGGFYTPVEAARALIGNLETSLGFWPYMAVVDAFQHWVYENPVEAHDLEQCNQTWSKIHRRFLPHLDWSGIEDSLEFVWVMQGHIFHDPFYYVEYGLALLGAAQVWANARVDQKKAVQDYRKALALGNTASLSELFLTAGAHFAFDVKAVKGAVDLIEGAIEELSEGL